MITDVASEAVRWGIDGLVPAVVQDAADGTVLMVGYVDREALEATIATGLAHFHSRSRGRLWQKGESSGNVLAVRDIRLDCDGDALLLTAAPAGPTCHTGARSCFDAETSVDARESAGSSARGESDESSGSRRDPAHGFAWLETLWATIASRATSDPAESYTARLLAGGVDAVGRKVVEEATEVLIAAKDAAAAVAAQDDRDRDDRSRASADRSRARADLASEVADLWFHALVLCAERGVAPDEVLSVLRARHRP